LRELELADAWAEIDGLAARLSAYCDPEIDLALVDNATARLLLDLAHERLSVALQRHGESRQALLREYEVAILSGDFGNALKVGRRLERGHRDTARGTLDLQGKARFYRQLAARWKPSSASPDYDIFVVNLDADTLRMERMRRQLENVDYQRIPAVKGAYLPEYLLRMATHSAGHQMKGTIGCFLSHIMVWERVVASGRHALVIEDDACLLGALPPSRHSIGLPRDYHLCFVNERMLEAGFEYPKDGFYLLSTESSVASKSNDWSSAGTDGYFVSPEGAQMLLDLVERDGIAGDVDWRLVSYSLPKRRRDRLAAAGGFRGEALAFHEPFRDGQTLRTYVLHPALVRQFDGGSVRLWDNQLPHAHMAIVAEKLANR
jgi:GR25 family glycosyltransferase involved in LPS biosynthesis